MGKSVDKMLTMPQEVVDKGQLLADYLTGGNFSMMVRRLIILGFDCWEPEERIAEGKAWAERFARLRIKDD